MDKPISRKAQTPLEHRGRPPDVPSKKGGNREQEDTTRRTLNRIQNEQEVVKLRPEGVVAQLSMTIFSRLEPEPVV